MKKSLIALVLVAALPALALAKKPTKAAPAEPAPVVEEENNTVTEECIINVSLFNESVKNKQYADAWEPWWQVYTTCPSANKAIYTRGDELVEWKIAQTQDPKEYDELRQLLLTLHDKRIKYFGDDPKYPTPYILGLKGVDYCNFYKEDPVKDPAYEWLKQSIEGMGNKSQIQVLKMYADLSNARYKLDPEKYATAYISDYQTVSMILAAQASDPANKNQARAQENKDYVDQMFASSGAANCEKLDEIFGPIVNDNLANLDMLNKIMAMFRRVKCTESEVYFTAAAASHKLEPTEESAAGCAKMCMKKADYKGAITYYEQALELAPEDDKEDRAEYLFDIAYIYFDKIKSYQVSRQYIRRSLELQASQGRCYILMGMLYAASQPYGEGMAPAKAAILNKTVFWAAVDKFQKAKMVDPEVAEDANKLIASYSKYFPTKEEIFDLPELQDGASFTVGGWIQETTTCRLQNNKFHIILSIAIVLVAMLLSASCRRKEVKLRMDAIDNRAAMPVLDAQEVTTLISDSGVTRFRITAREWQVYDKADPSYWEFPQGIFLEQFDHNLSTAATLRADYAHYNDQAEIWHLTGNVYATNVNGEHFETEELFWNQKTERIYSDSAITITQPPSGPVNGAAETKASIIKGVGFESNQDMTRYTIRRPTGIFPIEE